MKTGNVYSERLTTFAVNVYNICEILSKNNADSDNVPFRRNAVEINTYVIKLLQTIKDMENLEFFTESDLLNKTEFRLLQEVIVEGEQGNMLISAELARRLKVTRSAVSQIVCKLEERGIIERVPAGDDKKIAYIKLTDKTVELFNEQLKHVNEFMEGVVEEYGENKLKELIRAYDEFSAIMTRRQEEAKQEKLKGGE